MASLRIKLYVLPCNAIVKHGTMMGRAKYKIKPGDIEFSRDYLLSAMSDPNYEVRAPGAAEFRRYLSRIDIIEDPEHDAIILNRWCETCLSSDQWKRMKTTIRKRRYQKSNDDVTITLKADAHKVLLGIVADGKASTLSAAIEWLNEECKS